MKLKKEVTLNGEVVREKGVWEYGISFYINRNATELYIVDKDGALLGTIEADCCQNQGFIGDVTEYKGGV
jgi:hypothetical protein